VCSETESTLDWLHKNCFKEFVNVEKNMEEHRCVLAQSQDFSLELAFKLFSGSTLTRLSVSELEYGLHLLGVQA